MATTPKETQAHEVDSYDYEHSEVERLNTIAVGVSAYYTQENTETVHYDASKADPNIDPNVDTNIAPRLEWAQKTASFDAPIVGIHTHERMTSERVVRALLSDWVNKQQGQGFLFESDVLRRKRQADSLEAYKHSEAWTNRLIAGDSLLVMTSLLRKEAMAGKVQCVYMDPPYGISYGSNFQAFANKRDVKDKKDEDIPAQPEMVKAFRDTWELGIHSYLTYIRERLLVARELLADTGSCFVQIGDENVHLVRCVMDEVFGRGNFVS